jgi:hypothetical protein
MSNTLGAVSYGAAFRIVDGWRRVSIYLNGQVVGSIREERHGWRYFPKGQTIGGDLFLLLSDCRRSLEGS